LAGGLGWRYKIGKGRKIRVAIVPDLELWLDEPGRPEEVAQRVFKAMRETNPVGFSISDAEGGVLRTGDAIAAAAAEVHSGAG
jgi:hypothetical protein